jgi:drug/metabolite transporter (DMT)-like permease
MNKGFLLVLLSALCFSTKAIFAKLGFATGADAMQMLGLRMGFALPVFLGLLWRAERKAARLPNRRQILSLVALGVFGYYLSSLLDFLGLQQVTASLERLVLFLYPTLAVLFGAIIDRRLPSTAVWISLGLCFLGLTVSVGDVRYTDAQWLGIVLVFGSAITYAVYLTGIERWVGDVSPSRITAWSLSVSCLAVLAHCALAGTFHRPLPPAAIGWGATMAVVCTIFPTLLLSFGIRRIGAAPAAIASSLGPVFTITLASITLGERLTIGQLAGAVLVVAGVAYLGMAKKVPTVEPQA